MNKLQRSLLTGLSAWLVGFALSSCTRPTATSIPKTSALPITTQPTTAVHTESAPSPACPGKKLEMPIVTEQKRLEYIKRARFWMQIDTPSLDLLRGPVSRPYEYNQQVDCVYNQAATSQLGGTTVKMACDVPRPGRDPKTEKVKYGVKNGEVYCEILGSRIFWALGFAADQMYPVQVTCPTCHGRLYTMERTDEQNLAVSAIERKFDGDKIESYPGSGFNFDGEIDLVDPAQGGASVAERDAFLLMNSFTQHWDAKRDNQRLTCPEKEMYFTPSCEVECRQPYIMSHDYGEVFGSTAAQRRADLAAWKSMRIWTEPTGCKIQLEGGGNTGFFSARKISEEGRKAFLSRLRALSRAQVLDLFRSARLEHRNAATTVEMWADAFEEKVKEIESRRCD